MIIRRFVPFLFVTILSLSLSCTKKQNADEYIAAHSNQIQTDVPRLFQVYEEDFPIGVAIEPYQLSSGEGALLLNHFNTITAENRMKFLSIHPEADRYDFDGADKLADFARLYDLALRGHTFVWHHPAETADWMFENDDGSLKDRDVMLDMLEDHMRTLMKRYGDVVYAWDVVNEAIDVSESDNLRRTRWYDTIGPDYVARAFEMAHDIDPKARLFYNDYSTFDLRKGQAIYDFLEGMLADGVPIHGVGLQMHLKLGYPEISAIEEAIDRFRSLGLEIHITELDMSLYAEEFEVLETAPSDYLIHQAHRYQDIMDIFRSNSDVISNVTFWGLHDVSTWLRYDPYNRPDWPLLFTGEYQTKLAFDGLVGIELPEDPGLGMKRESLSFSAGKGTPVIDGVMDEIWHDAELLLADTHVMPDPGAYAEVRCLWDEEHFYVLARVYDDHLAAVSTQKHEQDSFELFLDEGNGKTTTYEKDDVQYRVNYKNRKSFGGYAGGRFIESAAVETEDGYIVEMAVKFQTIAPAAGHMMGVDFQVNDDKGGGFREGIAKWNDPSNESWRNTAGWGTVTLAE